VWGGGGLYRRVSVVEGQEIEPNRGDLRGARARDGIVLVLIFLGGMIGGPAVSATEEERAGTVLGRRGGWAVGRFRPWSEFYPRGPFLLFFSFHFFFSDFI
jgi:hypothetical protein